MSTKEQLEIEKNLHDLIERNRKIAEAMRKPFTLVIDGKSIEVFIRALTNTRHLPFSCSKARTSLQKSRILLGSSLIKKLFQDVDQ